MAADTARRVFNERSKDRGEVAVGTAPAASPGSPPKRRSRKRRRGRRRSPPTAPSSGQQPPSWTATSRVSSLERSGVTARRAGPRPRTSPSRLVSAATVRRPSRPTTLSEQRDIIVAARRTPVKLLIMNSRPVRERREEAAGSPPGHPQAKRGRHNSYARPSLDFDKMREHRFVSGCYDNGEDNSETEKLKVVQRRERNSCSKSGLCRRRTRTARRRARSRTACSVRCRRTRAAPSRREGRGDPRGGTSRGRLVAQRRPPRPLGSRVAMSPLDALARIYLASLSGHHKSLARLVATSSSPSLWRPILLPSRRFGSLPSPSFVAQEAGIAGWSDVGCAESRRGTPLASGILLLPSLVAARALLAELSF